MMPIQISERVSEFKESVTLKLNSQAVQMAKDGKDVLNLTAGQLPFKPDSKLVEGIKKECNFLESFQYAPVPGKLTLREKVIKEFVSDNSLEDNFELDCIISNGAKQSISNVLCSIINPGDEVIILSPFWVSYPPLIELYGGVVKLLESDFYENFVPGLEKLDNLISKKTKAIILNSPSNPSGIIYPKEWMSEFAKIMKAHPNLIIISDEIYRDLYYYDPRPSYFYNEDQSLLDQTIVIGGISKSMAATGLRIGWAIANKNFVKTLSKLQGQLTSGANSLIQTALDKYEFSSTGEFLAPIKNHLRGNLKVLREEFDKSDLSHKWYQARGAFYFIIDFSGTNIHQKYIETSEDKSDYSEAICQELLNSYGVACVPGSDFGLTNSARISLVSPKEEFLSAVRKITTAINSKVVC